MENWQIAAYYLLASGAAFLAYWLDKSAAVAGRWRIPENHLHLLSVIGGWPGAWFAQRVLRHKTKKQPFQTIYWITVALHLLMLVWLFSSHGQAVLYQLAQ